MKTDIIQLETHDDMISAQDKLVWSKSFHVILVWPKRGSNLYRRLDLVLLQRKAQQLGIQLTLVSRDPAVVTAAHEINIPIFATTKQAVNSTRQDQLSIRRNLLRPAGRFANGLDLRAEGERLHHVDETIWMKTGPRLALFSIGVLSVLVLALFFYPSAKVIVYPTRVTQSVELPLQASLSIIQTNPAGGIPAFITQTIVEGKQEAPATGSVAVADGFATGYVQVANLTDHIVDVPVDMVMTTVNDPPVRFKTTQVAQIPAGPGITTQVLVRAVLPGSSGNISAGQIQAVEGEMGLRLTVSNSADFSGGTERDGKAASSEDYRSLREALLSSLKQVAGRQIAAQLPTGEMLLQDSLQIKQIIEETATPPPGEPGDRIVAVMRVEFSAWYIHEQDMNKVAQAGLDLSLPAGYHPLAGSVKIKMIDSPHLAADLALIEWKIRVDREIEAAWTTDKVVGAVLGQNRTDAIRAVKSAVSLQQDPGIDINPFWWPRLPYFPFRIEVMAP